MEANFKILNSRILQVLFLFAISFSLLHCNDSAMKEECIECQSNEINTIKSRTKLLEYDQVTVKIKSYFDNFITDFESKYDLTKGTITILKESDELKTIWIPASKLSTNNKNGIYAYFYDNDIQIGYKVSWRQDSKGLRSITHSNLKDQNIYKVVENSKGETKLETLNITSSAISFGANKFALSNGRTTGAETDCSFITNMGSCVNTYIGQLADNWALGLSCMYFGEFCATGIAASCAIHATKATSQGNCL